MSDPLDLPDGISLGLDGGVTFSGKSGRALLLGLILRAKFSEPYSSDTLLNPWMASLAAGLVEPRPLVEGMADIGTSGEFRAEVGRLVAFHSARLGWWKMSHEERISLIRDVIAAPHPISDFNAEEIILDVEDNLSNAKRLVEAAAVQSEG